MWPFVSYPEVSPSDVDAKAYDYIVVGGGTAGCVVASRLSEDPSVSVLVIEKGAVKDTFLSRVPLISQNFFMGGPLQVQGTRYSEPMPEVNGRRNRLWTAEGIGGASRINGMVFTRGVPGGYEEWARDLGLDEWAWKDVEPYFRKSENATKHPGESWRGHNGPLKLRHSAWPFIWPTFVDKAAKNIGLAVNQNCNDPTAPASGLFDLDMAIDENSYRNSTYRAFLNKDIALQRRKRLTVCTGAVVSRLDVDARAGVVRGVFLKSAVHNDDSRESYAQAKREVIVCSGAICTPQILMLSGIGPRDQLQANGIAVVKELPVGANLQDHVSAAVMLTIPKSESLSLLESIYGLWHLLLFIFLGRGLLAGNATPKTVFVNSKAIDEDSMVVTKKPNELDAMLPENIPNIEIMIHPVNSFEAANPGHSLLTLYATLVQPESRGRVELASDNPLANPRIIHPMLRNPRDWVPLRHSIRFAMRLAEEFHNSGYPHPSATTFAPGTNPHLLDKYERSHQSSANPDAPVPRSQLKFKSLDDEASTREDGMEHRQANKTWMTVTDDEIDDYVRRVGMGSLHSSCTCPMSRDEKSGGVVDQRLRVHGVNNLRIADASVFPKIPSGHTMAPTIMVAERCADFVKAEWLS